MSVVQRASRSVAAAAETNPARQHDSYLLRSRHARRNDCLGLERHELYVWPELVEVTEVLHLRALKPSGINPVDVLTVDNYWCVVARLGVLNRPSTKVFKKGLNAFGYAPVIPAEGPRLAVELTMMLRQLSRRPLCVVTLDILTQFTRASELKSNEARVRLVPHWAVKHTLWHVEQITSAEHALSTLTAVVHLSCDVVSDLLHDVPMAELLVARRPNGILNRR